MGFFSRIFRKTSDTLKDLVEKHGYTSIDDNPLELDNLQALLAPPSEQFPQGRKLRIESAVKYESSRTTTYVALATSATRLPRHYSSAQTGDNVASRLNIRVLKSNCLKGTLLIRRKMPPIAEGLVGRILEEAVESESGKKVTESVLPEFEKGFAAYTFAGSDAELPRDVQYLLAENLDVYPLNDQSGSTTINLDKDGFLLQFPTTRSTEKLLGAIEICQKLVDRLY